jgi:hypothetical protein
MSQFTIAAPDVVDNRSGARPPEPPPPADACAPDLWARVFAQLTRMLAQMAQR